MKKLQNNQLLHLIPILLLAGYLLWHMLAVTHYNHLKWWEYFASDFECGVVTSALGLLNDARPINHVLYPAVTLFNFDAAALRLAATFSSHYGEIFNVDGFSNIKEVFLMLDEAAGITRINVIPMNIFWMVIMYFLFYWILKNRIMACLWTLFFFTETHVNYYHLVMRPEVFSLAFYFLAVLLSINFFKRTVEEFTYQRCLKYFIPVGLLIGLSIFSKIQIFPALIIYFGAMFFYLFQTSNEKIIAASRKIKFCLGNIVTNIILFPWWTMARPDHVTPELLRRWPWSDLYGPPPGKESFMAIPIVIFLLCFALTLVVMALSKNKESESFAKKATLLLMYLNMLITGIIFSIYITGLGGFVSLSGYMENTQNFVYSTISNFYFAGQMDHKILNMDNFKRIYDQFIDVPFFVFSFFYVVIAGFLFSTVRFFWKGGRHKIFYFFSLLMIGLGFGFDVLATLRAEVYMFNYGVYSVSFYVLGLVSLTSGELHYIKKLKSKKTQLLVFGAIVAIFLIHTLMVSSKFVTDYPPGKPRYVGDYKPQFNHCIWQSKFFWDVVEADLYDSDAFDQTREAGRQFKWGQKNTEIINQIKKQNVTQQFLTPEDKLGKLDELMVNYTHQIQYKTYLYSFILSASDQMAAQGQVDAALANYTQAIGIFPHLPDAYQKRGDLYFRKQMYSNSLKDIFTAKRLGAQIDSDQLRKAKRAASAR